MREPPSPDDCNVSGSADRLLRHQGAPGEFGANQPSFVDGSEEPSVKRIYYHHGSTWAGPKDGGYLGHQRVRMGFTRGVRRPLVSPPL